MNKARILKSSEFHFFNFSDIEEICLIDDDPAFIFLNQMILKTIYPEIQTQSFNNIKDAFYHFQTFTTTKRLVILDINLGLTTGFELLDILNTQTFKNMDVIMHSSCSDEAYVQKAFTYPLVKVFIVKPLSIELVELISGKISSIENQPNFKNVIFTRETFAAVS